MDEFQQYTQELAKILPIQKLIVTLEFTQDTRPSFFHQPALSAFIRYLIGSPENFAYLFRLEVPESGRVYYAKNDKYRFSIIGLNGSKNLMAHCVKKIKELPHSSKKISGPLAFKNNLKLIQLNDGLTGKKIHSFSELLDYDINDFQQELSVWSIRDTLILRLYTPTRLLKPYSTRNKGPKKLKGDERFCHSGSDLSSELISERLYTSVEKLVQHKVGKLPAQKPYALLNLADCHVFWVDAHYRNEKGVLTPAGGMLGWLRLHLNLPQDKSILALLVITQYTGFGQSTPFGWGRNQLIDEDNGFSVTPVAAAEPLLKHVSSEQNLSDAWRHISSGADIDSWQHAIDEDEYEYANEANLPDDINLAPIARLKRSFKKIQALQYTPPELYGRLIPKKSGGYRALSIPPAYDRILQRAISQCLTPALEQIMFRHSHGYRKGRSRITARFDIQVAWREGYRWVFESDVRDFFNSVSLKRLHERLFSLFGQDPLVANIIAWMSAPVRFEGERIERKNGIPQGSPLSPLMANLMLDDFDEDMHAAGFKMIRYADDFVVMCKSPEQAEQAKITAIASLAEHELGLHPDKTRIVAMDDGFKYLGYLFINDMALDISGADKTANQPLASPNSWLAILGEKQATKIKQQDAIAAVAKQLAKQKPLSVGSIHTNGQLVVITGAPTKLVTRNKNLQVFRQNKSILQQPWQHIEAVILFGPHQITTQAMHAALYHNVSIHLSTGYGRYHGVITQQKPSWGHRLWLEQLLVCRDEDKSLYLARELISARLKHMKEMLRLRKRAYDIPMLNIGIQKVNHVQSLESLRGIEGKATLEYFQRISSLIAQYGFEFAERNRRPPRDPFNVLLSLGYTIVFGYCQSIIHASGLLPWEGFYHQTKGRHAALASDLMEPFRHLVERVAMTLILRKQIVPQDFTMTKTGRCVIEPDKKRKFVALLLLRWETVVKAKGETQPVNYFSQMQRQCHSLREFVRSGEAFASFQLR